MALFRDDPQDELFLIENPGADKKEGTRIEQLCFGKEAFYFPPQKYLPYRAVKGAEIIPTSFHVTGCCGKSLPAFAVKVRYGEEGKFVPLVMEKKENAERAMGLILEGAGL